MAKQLQLRKGTATEHDTFTGANGEVTVDTTNKTLRVHDGVTVGGTILATVTGGLVPVSQLPDATTSTKGAVILNNTLASTSTTQALTAAQGKVLNDQAFGVGQTSTNVTSSRSKGVTYTNSSGKPIFVSVICGNEDGDGGSSLLVNGSAVSKWRPGYGTRGAVTISYVILNGWNYSVECGGNIKSWWEVR